jgi:hypothetical protein
MGLYYYDALQSTLEARYISVPILSSTSPLRHFSTHGIVGYGDNPDSSRGNSRKMAQFITATYYNKLRLFLTDLLHSQPEKSSFVLIFPWQQLCTL